MRHVGRLVRRHARRLAGLFAVCLLLPLAACVRPEQQHRTLVPAFEPRLDTDSAVMDDGTVLPLQVWRPAGRPRAVILGLHGMNDYANGFSLPAAAWAKAGIVTYAYDQRGFGRTPRAGVWGGTDNMIRDMRAVLRLVRSRHPGLPVYLVGISMGGAVAIAGAASQPPPRIAGLIVVAPAVWSRSTLPLAYQASLFVAAHTVPQLELTGRGLKLRPTDNIELLRKMSRDKWTLKGARIDLLWGVVDLMDRADRAAPGLGVPVLYLYGKKDEIMPHEPTLRALARLPARRLTFGYYRKGWHMLLRDLQRETVYRDILAWMADKAAPLPSKADRDGALMRKWMAKSR